MSRFARRVVRGKKTPASGGIAGLSRVSWEGGAAYWAQFGKAAATGWTNPSFFPMISFSNSFSSDAEIQWDSDHGINVYHGLNPYSDYTMLLNHPGMYYVGDPYADVYSGITMPSSFSRWVGYNTPDEIDGTSADGPTAISDVTTTTNGYRAANDGRFIAANYTQLVVRNDWQPYGSQLVNHSGVDGVSIDMYWYTSFAGHDQIVAMSEICATVRTYAAIINTQSYAWDFGDAADTMLKASGGYAYIFAMIDQTGDPGSRTFTLPAGITGSNVDVLDESRTLTINGSHQFTDTFTYEYSYHIYRITI